LKFTLCPKRGGEGSGEGVLGVGGSSGAITSARCIVNCRLVMRMQEKGEEKGAASNVHVKAPQKIQQKKKKTGESTDGTS